MNRITGRSAFLALLKDEGITHLFGNPGTTELPIMHALKEHPDLTYVLGLQEAIVVAMADGFSRASGRLVACNVHVAPGLGNAMGSLFNAKFTGTPMILTAGQQEQGHGLTEPLLYDSLVPIAAPLVKWAVEVTRLEDLPRIAQWQGHDLAALVPFDNGRSDSRDVVRKHIGAHRLARIAGRHNQKPIDDVAELPHIAGPSISL